MGRERERLRSATDLRMAIINGDSRSTSAGWPHLTGHIQFQPFSKCMLKGFHSVCATSVGRLQRDHGTQQK